MCEIMCVKKLFNAKVKEISFKDFTKNTIAI